MKNLNKKESFFVSIDMLALRHAAFVFCMVFASFMSGSVPIYAQSTSCHTVQFGDTLTSIAARYGTTVSLIMQTNRIANANSIRVGQQICFETPSTNAEVVVTVAPANSLPRATATPAPAESTPLHTMSTPAVAPRVAPTQPATIYIVRRGDSLFRIGRLFGVSLSELMMYNGLTSTTIYTGQTIRIPSR